ncbi:oxygenase MpaB family protein [Nonomuraea sp. NEAU-A123]|uniref:oxygenase MpaB family protein n=1 Tax=Nonomuraea sp. NEAU-A123 TaxID=2839649 RepID=UPI001BE46A8C|nr:oxygenase MpaB family protein [Nonomuraea sp. NEAU-A123]MBT2229690.1 hypothetical protein [Nonomuraea sp. NEAU-A123]
MAGGVVNACGRLRRQLGFVAVRTFGTREQVGQRIRRAHAMLIGLDSDTGTRLGRAHVRLRRRPGTEYAMNLIV